MQLHCPVNYYVDIKSAKLMKSGLVCFGEECHDKDAINYVGSICNGNNPCTIIPQNDWGFSTMTIEYKCNPNEFLYFFNYYSAVVGRSSESTRPFCCADKATRRKRQDDDHDDDHVDCNRTPRLSLDTVRNSIRSLYDRNRYGIVDMTPSRDNAITEYFFYQMTHRSTGHVVNLPLMLTAEIELRHVEPRVRPAHPDIREYLQREMDMQDGDQCGHILAHSLGGPSTRNNFVPMARRINQGDFWRHFERSVPMFLRDNANGRVLFQVHILYLPSFASFRPVGFGLRIRYYTDRSLNSLADDRTLFTANEQVPLSSGCSTFPAVDLSF